MRNSRISCGVISEPPPTPVIPTRKPTAKPESTKRGCMVSNRAILGCTNFGWGRNQTHSPLWDNALLLLRVRTAARRYFRIAGGVFQAALTVSPARLTRNEKDRAVCARAVPVSSTAHLGFSTNKAGGTAALPALS